MAYTRVNWQNSPSHATPLSAENLNVMDAGIASLDTAVTEAEGDISSLETTVSGHTTSIGTLANLTTTEKSNLVGAINEVNEDVSDVKEDLATLNEGEYIYGFVPNSYINANGDQVTYNGWKSSDYIPVTEYSVKISSIHTTPYCAYYDANKTFLSRFTLSAGDAILYPPANAVYCRFSDDNTNFESITITMLKTDKTLSIEYRPADAKTVGDRLKDIKNNAVELYSVNKQLGVIYSTRANTETNTLQTIDSSTNRMIVGPFQLSKSVVISCDSSVKYQMYKRYGDSEYFINIYGSWQTGEHIEGANKLIGEICNYYMQLSYSDDRNIFSLDDLLTRISLVESDDNPFGLVECSGMVSGTGMPNIYTGAKRLTAYKCSFDADKVLLYCGNGNIRTGVLTGEDVYNSASDSGLSFGCKALSNTLENVVWFQDYTNNTNTSIEFKNFASFKDLYDFLGVHLEEINVDNDHITGSQLSDAHLLVEADTYGKTVQNNIFSDGVFLDDNGDIKFAHVPSLQVADGYAFVTFLCDRVNTYESSPYTEIDVAKIDLSDNSVEYTVIAKNGTYGGITFNGRCSYPATILADDKLHIYFSGTVNGVQALCHSTYDIASSEYSTSICNVIDGENSYAFNTTNFDRYIGGKYGIQPLDYEIGICNPTGANGTYYTTLCSGSNGQIKTAVMHTTNFVDWIVYDVLPFKYGGDCEVVSLYKSGYLYIASRHSYAECTTLIYKYNLSTKKVEQDMQIGSVASRPTMFFMNNNVVLSNPLSGRRTMQMMQIPDTNIRTGRLICSMNSWLGLAYNSIKQVGNDAFFAIQTSKSGASTYSDYPKIYFGKSELSA